MNGGPGPARLRPFFSTVQQAQLLCLLYEPAPGAAIRAPVLFFPPFAEEMNKARRMMALQARALADSGRPVLVVDLYGTGESAGDFVDARWETWVAGLIHSQQWLTEQYGAKPVLWALRTGALLAAEVLQSPEASSSDLVLWQPVISGQQFFTQFLRLKVAAEMSGAGQGADTKTLRADLKAGKSVEIAGYEIAGPLAMALDSKSLDATSLRRAGHVAWFEVSASAEPAISPASRRVIDACQGEGMALHNEVVAGLPFWSTPETSVAPALIDATSAYVARSLA